MNWYPWLNAPYRQLIGQYQAGRGHHALLIHADEGNGDAALVYGLSRWLLCQHPQGEKSCGECHSCRLMLAGNHPDWHVLTPEKGKASLGIDRVRQVIDGLYTHAQQGGAKVIWLAQAEALTEAAANALLKTLEEPPEKTYFLLGCRTPSRLLPTLRSRCSYWHLQNPPPALSSQWIQRQQPADPQSVETALKLSHGAPLAAAALLQPERWQQRQQCHHTGPVGKPLHLFFLLVIGHIHPHPAGDQATGGRPCALITHRERVILEQVAVSREHHVRTAVSIQHIGAVLAGEDHDAHPLCAALRRWDFIQKHLVLHRQRIGAESKVQAGGGGAPGIFHAVGHRDMKRFPAGIVSGADPRVAVAVHQCRTMDDRQPHVTLIVQAYRAGVIAYLGGNGQIRAVPVAGKGAGNVKGDQQHQPAYRKERSFHVMAHYAG